MCFFQELFFGTLFQEFFVLDPCFLCIYYAESLAKSLAETLSKTLGETLSEILGETFPARQASCQES